MHLTSVHTSDARQADAMNDSPRATIDEVRDSLAATGLLAAMVWLFGACLSPRALRCL